MDTGKKIKMTVEMEVTIPQALALEAMFECWNSLSSAGSSRYVAFYADGDGNFHPNCTMEFSEEVPELTDELKELALVSEDKCDIAFDFDAIGWKFEDK